MCVMKLWNWKTDSYILTRETIPIIWIKKMPASSWNRQIQIKPNSSSKRNWTGCAANLRRVPPNLNLGSTIFTRSRIAHPNAEITTRCNWRSTWSAWEARSWNWQKFPRVLVTINCWTNLNIIFKKENASELSARTGTENLP